MQYPNASVVVMGLAALVAYALGECLVRSAHRHGHLTADPTSGVQKVHERPTPRVGGIAIYLALTAVWLVLQDAEQKRLIATVLLAAMPAFAAGFLEDVTKRVGVKPRLLATVASGMAASCFTGAAITRVGIPGLDSLLWVWPAACLLTAFAVGGVANAVNIIDGFHGLASGTVIISLAGLAVIAAQAGDPALAAVACMFAAAVFGFALLNFPWGRLFLGDGGAYLCGFGLAWLTVELLARNASVSPWAGVLLCGYPTLEVLYSMVRRRRMRLSPGMADHQHLHSLIGTGIVMPRCARLPPDLRNSAVSVVMWPCAMLPVVLGVAYYEQPRILLLAMLVTVALYHGLYRKVVALASRRERARAAGARLEARRR